MVNLKAFAPFVSFFVRLFRVLFRFFKQNFAVVPFRELDAPVMTAEDFSWYQRSLPGMFFLLGVGDVPALHSDQFHFDEEILLKGAGLFETLAEKFL